MVANLTHSLIRGRTVTALGVIFDFTANDQNTTVQKVEDMVKESWVCLILIELERVYLLCFYSSWKLLRMNQISFY